MIPKSVFKKRDSWWSIKEVEKITEISLVVLSQLVKEKKLKSRILNKEDGTDYLYIFLKKENEKILKEQGISMLF